MEANSPSLGQCFEIGRTLDRHSLGKGYAWEISKVINQQTASSVCQQIKSSDKKMRDKKMKRPATSV